MALTLKEILTLVGRLDDTPGFDTPRERFRRFVSERVEDVEGIRALLAQCQEALGDQHARARQDLVVMLGRFLGFEVAFGPYAERGGEARFEGHWRSRRQVRIVIDVRSEQTDAAEVDALSRSVAALAATMPAEDERWVGLCVTTPFYAARRQLVRLLDQREAQDIRCVTIESLLWLAESAAAGRLEHRDVVRLLTSGPDSEFMIDLMRRFETGTVTGSRSPAPAAAPAADTGSTAAPVVVPTEPARVEPAREPKAHVDGAPHLSIVPDRPRDPRFWLAVLSNDDATTPEQLLDAVIRRRHLLGIVDMSLTGSQAQAGDWICLHIEGSGVVGYARVEGTVLKPERVIRDAHRFGAVFRLADVTLFDARNAAAEEHARTVVGRIPLQTAPTWLAPLSRDDYHRLTRRDVAGARAATS